MAQSKQGNLLYQRNQSFRYRQTRWDVQSRLGRSRRAGVPEGLPASQRQDQRGQSVLGTDLNGLVKGPQPSKGVDIYNAVFPLSRSADKKWDYRTEGVAHYGMMADFLRDIFSLPSGAQVEEQIMKNAEFFAQMWEKAVAQSKVPQA